MLMASTTFTKAPLMSDVPNHARNWSKYISLWRVSSIPRRIDGIAKVIPAFVELGHFFAEGDAVGGFANGHGGSCPHANSQMAMFTAIAPGFGIVLVVEFLPLVVGRQEFTGLFNLVVVRSAWATLFVDELESVLEEILGAGFIEPDGIHGCAPKDTDGIFEESATIEISIVAKTIGTDPAPIRSHPVGDHAHAVTRAF